MSVWVCVDMDIDIYERKTALSSNFICHLNTLIADSKNYYLKKESSTENCNLTKSFHYYYFIYYIYYFNHPFNLFESVESNHKQMLM